MKKHETDAAALLRRIAHALEESFSGDARLHAAVAKLQQLDLSVAVRLELVAGREDPTVTLEERHASVPEWSRADEELLRSLGIDAQSDGRGQPHEGKSRRRQPR